MSNALNNYLGQSFYRALSEKKKLCFKQLIKCFKQLSMTMFVSRAI